MYIKRLEEICERENIKFTDLSQYINIDRSTLGKYINGYLIMPLKHLNAICNYFNISIDYVFCLTDNRFYSRYENEIDSKLFCLRIKEVRKKNNLTQKELAKVLNCSHSAISEYEHNKRLITTSHLYAICRKFHVSADYLLGKINC